MTQDSIQEFGPTRSSDRHRSCRRSPRWHGADHAHAAFPAPRVAGSGARCHAAPTCRFPDGSRSVRRRRAHPTNARCATCGRPRAVDRIARGRGAAPSSRRRSPRRVQPPRDSRQSMPRYWRALPPRDARGTPRRPRRATSPHAARPPSAPAARRRRSCHRTPRPRRRVAARAGFCLPGPAAAARQAGAAPRDKPYKPAAQQGS
jgi:hypothetical protein